MAVVALDWLTSPAARVQRRDEYTGHVVVGTKGVVLDDEGVGVVGGTKQGVASAWLQRIY